MCSITMRIAHILPNSWFEKILDMQTLGWLYHYIKYKSINVTCKVRPGPRLPNWSGCKLWILVQTIYLWCAVWPLPLSQLWPDSGDKLSDVTTRGPRGWGWSESDIRDNPAQAGQMGLRWDDDHFIEWRVSSSFMRRYPGIRWGMQRFEGREVLRIVDLQTAKKSAMIMKLSVANSSHCCGWGGDKSKHRTTPLQHFITFGDYLLKLTLFRFCYKL